MRKQNVANLSCNCKVESLRRELRETAASLASEVEAKNGANETIAGLEGEAAMAAVLRAQVKQELDKKKDLEGQLLEAKQREEGLKQRMSVVEGVSEQRKEMVAALKAEAKTIREVTQDTYSLCFILNCSNHNHGADGAQNTSESH